MRTPREGQGLRRVGVCPFTGDGIENIERVVVGGPLSAAENEDSPIYQRRSVRPAGRWEVTCHLRVGPLERLCETIFQERVQGTSEMDAPMSKVHKSFAQPLSSHPPNNHAVFSTSVTVCARMLRLGRCPYTGARDQYMSVGGAGSAGPCGR